MPLLTHKQSQQHYSGLHLLLWRQQNLQLIYDAADLVLKTSTDSHIIIPEYVIIC
jgi:hypothetical protein